MDNINNNKKFIRLALFNFNINYLSNIEKKFDDKNKQEINKKTKNFSKQNKKLNIKKINSQNIKKPIILNKTKQKTNNKNEKINNKNEKINNKKINIPKKINKNNNNFINLF